MWLVNYKKCFSALCCALVTRGFCCVWSERLDADDWLNEGGGQSWSSHICLDLNFPLFWGGGQSWSGQICPDLNFPLFFGGGLFGQVKSVIKKKFLIEV